MKRLCVLILILPAVLGVLQNPILYIRIGDIFQDSWKEPFEVAYIVMYDGKVFEMTTKESCRVGAQIGQILDYLKSQSYEVGDIVLMVHNHFMYPRFSPGDEATYHELKRRGFTGAFVIYHVPTGKYIPHKDN